MLVIKLFKIYKNGIIFILFNRKKHYTFLFGNKE